MTRNEELEATIVAKFVVMSPLLNERARRLWAAAESIAIGYGGDALVSAATGLARETIRNGRRELADGAPALGRIRRPGAGRPNLEQDQPGLTAALERLVDPLTRGDPTSPLRWTCKSRAQLTAALTAEGWRVSSSAVGRLLHALGYRLQALRKTREGQQHPDRHAQFEHINATATTFLRRGQPVISVDTKKKELVGDVKNAGREWQPTQTPEHVQVHDFPTQAAGKAIPYGVYDMARNEAWVSVGRDHDTSAFAVAAIRQWWGMMGRAAYPTARHLLITADAGGSNGYRTRAWKTELQRLADDLQLRITVCHFPPGTSKWNKIEHRLFCHITTNWRGRALRTFETIVDLIGHTSTVTGLRVRAKLDKRRYRTGVKVTAAEMRDVALHRHESPSLKDFMALTSYWRWMGTTQRLDGPDTSGDKTADILAVMTGRANERIVQTEQDLAAFREDTDGELRYTLNSLSCSNATWQQALDRLLGKADVVVMDLSSLSSERLGCKYELGTWWN